jgi:CrcB protein
MWKELLYVGAGGFVGAIVRFLMSRSLARWLGASYPYGTLFVNFTGSVLLGFFLTWVTQRVLADYHLRIFVAIGFCGAYTTFSSYSFETFVLLEQRHYWLAASNFLANNVLALAGVVGGAMLARSL